METVDTTYSSELNNNTIYKKSLPNFILVLSVVYLCMYLIRSIQIVYRKNQRKKEEIEKNRLRYYWKKVTLQNEINADQENGITYPPSAHPSSSSSTTLKGSLFNTCQDEKSANQFWSKRQGKRLNLLWQWSVSMGYCEYPHGKELNEMIRILSTQETNP